MQKLLNRITASKVIKEILDRYTSASKDRRPALDVW